MNYHGTMLQSNGEHAHLAKIPGGAWRLFLTSSCGDVCMRVRVCVLAVRHEKYSTIWEMAYLNSMTITNTISVILILFSSPVR